MSNHVPSTPFKEQEITKAADTMKLSVSDVLSYLNELGIDDDRMLKAGTTKEGDARAIFVDKHGVKIARFCAGWAILKGVEKSEESNLIIDVMSTLRPVSQWKDNELIEAYGPDCSSEIASELRRRSNDRPFIAFDGDMVNVNASIRMLHVARRRNTPSIMNVEGHVYRLCRVGEFPMIWIEECPIHSDIALVNGWCEKCLNDWSILPEEDRIYVRVAINNGTKLDAVGIHDLIKKGIERIRIPSNDLAFKTLKEDDRLPKLRRKLSSTPNSKADPFFQHRDWNA
jgi:hypothetical protein